MVYCLGRLLPLDRLVTGLNDTLCSSMVEALASSKGYLGSLQGASRN